MIPILQVWKWRLRKMQWLIQGHRAKRDGAETHIQWVSSL